MSHASLDYTPNSAAKNAHELDTNSERSAAIGAKRDKSAGSSFLLTSCGFGRVHWAIRTTKKWEAPSW